MDQWEVCNHGEETLGTSLHNMSAPTRGSKQSGSIRKATVLGHPTPGRKEDSMGKKKRGGGAEGATPNRKRQQ